MDDVFYKSVPVLGDEDRIEGSALLSLFPPPGQERKRQDWRKTQSFSTLRKTQSSSTLRKTQSFSILVASMGYRQYPKLTDVATFGGGGSSGPRRRLHVWPRQQ